MGGDGYVFGDVERLPELERLRSIERIFDPATQGALRSTGLREGWTCLEVGPGAGSVLAWLAHAVGSSGRVTAVDLDPRFLRDVPRNAEVLSGDIRTVPLPPAGFDLIHARYVLIHVPAAEAAVERLLGLLKPGGWIVLEEPDFSAARAVDGPDADAFEAVKRAIGRMYAAQGIDAAFGARLPAMLECRGVKAPRVERDETVSEGGSAMALMMAASGVALREKYLATGEVEAGDLERYLRFARDPRSRAVYYATVRVVGRA